MAREVIEGRVSSCESDLEGLLSHVVVGVVHLGIARILLVLVLGLRPRLLAQQNLVRTSTEGILRSPLLVYIVNRLNWVKLVALIGAIDVVQIRIPRRALLIVSTLPTLQPVVQTSGPANRAATLQIEYFVDLVPVGILNMRAPC